MRSLSKQAQRFFHSLDRRIPNSVSLTELIFDSVNHRKSSLLVSMEQRSIKHNEKRAAHTGPVMTLLDLVVHVPVNCGSVCANTEDTSSTPAASGDGSDTIIEYKRWIAEKKNGRNDTETSKEGM